MMMKLMMRLLVIQKIRHTLERNIGKTLESGGTSKLSERAIRNFWHNYRSDMDLA